MAQAMLLCFTDFHTCTEIFRKPVLSDFYVQTNTQWSDQSAGFPAYITWALNASQLTQETEAMTFRLFSVCLALAFPIIAGAATWIEVGSNDSVLVLVDKDSLRRNGNKVKSWLKWQWVKPVEVPNAFPVNLYQLERQLQISDCQNNTLAIAQGIRYTDALGNEVVDSYAFEEKSWRFTEVAPETLGESIIKFVCKAAAKKRKRTSVTN